MPGDMPSGTTGISRNYSSIKVISHRPSIRSPFEAGYVQTRSKWTTAKREFAISWKSMTAQSHASLLYFFETTCSGASSFIWHDPTANSGSGVTREVIFLDDSLEFDNVHQDYFSGSIRIREV